MPTSTDEQLGSFEIAHQLLSLQEEYETLEEPRMNALDVLGIQSNERRLTRFLEWLLTPDASHSGGDAFLSGFLELCKLSGVSVTSVESFFVVSDETDHDKTEIDLVLTGDNVCIGVEIKTTHQESKSNLREEYAALERSFPNVDYLQLVYLTFAPEDRPVPRADYPTIMWSDLCDRINDEMGEVPNEYEKQLINDFLDTIRQHVMKDFNGLSDRTELYLKYSDAIDEAKSAYETDRERIIDALASEFFETPGIDDSWERSDPWSGRYVQFYKPEWRSLENGVKMELEPHPRLKKENTGRCGIEEPYIRVRFDVEGKSAQTVRDAILERLGTDGREELESEGFDWFSRAESTNEFIGKPVPLTANSENYDPIAASNEAMQTLLEILDDHLNAIVNEY